MSVFSRALADTLLPGGRYPNGVELPPASALGLVEIDGAVLAMVAAAAGGEDAFLAADAARREAAVGAASIADPAGFNRGVAKLVTCYYEDARVIAAFGWPSRPPQPLGHALQSFDEALLHPVKVRKTLWRGISSDS